MVSMPPFFIALCGSIVGASPQFTQPFLQHWPFGLFPDARVLCLRTDFVRSRCVYPDSEEQDCFVPLSMCPPGGDMGDRVSMHPYLGEEPPGHRPFGLLSFTRQERSVL